MPKLTTCIMGLTLLCNACQPKQRHTIYTLAGLAPHLAQAGFRPVRSSDTEHVFAIMPDRTDAPPLIIQTIGREQTCISMTFPVYATDLNAYLAAHNQLQKGTLQDAWPIIKAHHNQAVYQFLESAFQISERVMRENTSEQTCVLSNQNGWRIRWQSPSVVTPKDEAVQSIITLTPAP